MSPGRTRLGRPVCRSATSPSARSLATSAAMAAAAPVVSGAATRFSRPVPWSGVSTGNRSRAVNRNASARATVVSIDENRSLVNASRAGAARKLRAIDRRTLPSGRSARTWRCARVSIRTSASRNA